jgi:hypothetical protein
MSERSTQQSLSQLTLWPEGHLASLCPSPGSEEARRMTAGSGAKLSALLPVSDPAGVCLRILLASSAWGSTLCYLAWKLSATPAGRPLFRLVPSVPRTEGTGCGLWPTPVAQDDNKSPEAHLRMKARMKGGPRHKITSLQVMAKAVQARMWPTPQANKCTANTKALSDLVNADGTPWTPGRKPHDKRTGKPVTTALADAVRMWPTPQSRDYRTGDAPGSRRQQRKQKQGWSQDLNDAVQGQLNPKWVECLMGLPVGWTAIDGPLPSGASSTSGSRRA